MMSKKKEPICPMLRKPCIGADCTMWTHITGEHPQSGAQMDLWDCAVKWTPIMMLEASRRTKGVQAAVETMRNDVVDQQSKLTNALTMGARLMAANQHVAIPQTAGVESKALEG